MEKKLMKAPTVTSMITGGRRRLLYSYDDGSQMLEEYDMKTHQLLTRMTKAPKGYKESPWLYEVGEASSVKSTEQPLLKSLSGNPIFLRKDEMQNFQWRIRNLTYPVETYLVQIDNEKQEVVVKTTNKKYYKRFEIGDMKRRGLKLEKGNLSHDWKTNTLIITYRKPEEILKKELELRKQFEKLNQKKPKQNDIQCTTQ